MRHQVRLCAAFALALALAWTREEISAATLAHTHFVPWKVLNSEADRVRGQLILYWIPASREDIRRSLLLTSRPLATYATRCVGMQVVRPDDSETLSRLEATDSAPAAVLADSTGTIIARVAGEKAFTCTAVERMVHEALTERIDSLDRALDRAREHMGAGERDQAIDLYRSVYAQRCLAARKAQEAERALRKMGVPLQ